VLLKAGYLPLLQDLHIAGHWKDRAFTALVKALTLGPFAQSLRILHLGGFYDGPADLNPLINAVKNCPNMESMVIGDCKGGPGSLVHWLDFMELLTALFPPTKDSL